MDNFSQCNKTPYSFEFPIPSTTRRFGITGYAFGGDYATIEECVKACKTACAKHGVNYDDRDVKLFMTDADGKWEITEECELAG